MQTKQIITPSQPVVNGRAAAIAMEHPRYYTGKYLTTRDFEDEHEYGASRHRLHNRLLHGWGIVCGLEVRHHPHWEHNRDGECARRWVVVKPGIAIDCYGREIVVSERLYFELPLPHYHDHPAEGYTGAYQSETTAQTTEAEKNAMYGSFLLGICYDEVEIEAVPPLYAEGPYDSKHLEANRVREQPRLVVCRLDEVDATCWRSHTGEGEHERCDDCDEEPVGPAGSCLQVSNPCHDMVPLALIKPPAHHHHQHEHEFEQHEHEFEQHEHVVEQHEHDYRHGFDIAHEGRRYVGSAPELLTHIVDINWPHAGEVTLDHLREKMKGQLRITFDRRLHRAEGGVTAINEHTFVVQIRDFDDDLSFVRTQDRRSPTLGEDGYQAIYTIEDRSLRSRSHNLANSTIYVTLKCDLIPDCHHNPVDGNFLGARFPTGDGVKGGNFESWFRVVPDGERQEREP